MGDTLLALLPSNLEPVLAMLDGPSLSSLARCCSLLTEAVRNHLHRRPWAFNSSSSVGVVATAKPTTPPGDLLKLHCDVMPSWIVPPFAAMLRKVRIARIGADKAADLLDAAPNLVCVNLRHVDEDDYARLVRALVGRADRLCYLVADPRVVPLVLLGIVEAGKTMPKLTKLFLDYFDAADWLAETDDAAALAPLAVLCPALQKLTMCRSGDAYDSPARNLRCAPLPRGWLTTIKGVAYPFPTLRGLVEQTTPWLQQYTIQWLTTAGYIGSTNAMAVAKRSATLCDVSLNFSFISDEDAKRILVADAVDWLRRPRPSGVPSKVHCVFRGDAIDDKLGEAWLSGIDAVVSPGLCRLPLRYVGPTAMAAMLCGIDYPDDSSPLPYRDLEVFWYDVDDLLKLLHELARRGSRPPMLSLKCIDMGNTATEAEALPFVDRLRGPCAAIGAVVSITVSKVVFAVIGSEEVRCRIDVATPDAVAVRCRLL